MTDYECDVAIYGDSISGDEAAIAASSRGQRVILIVPCGHLGGMPAAGGLCFTDIGEVPELFSGPARVAFDEALRYYGNDGAQFAGPEPHVAETLMERRVAQAGVTVIRHGYLRLESGVSFVPGSSPRRVQSIIIDTASSVVKVTARYFIDASIEGDLMAAAGISYRLGREDTLEYGEQFAGRRPLSREIDDVSRGGWPKKHDYGDGVLATDSHGLLPGINAEPMVGVGRADRGIMEPQFRANLCMNPENQSPFRRPDDYDARTMQLLARNISATRPPTVNSYLCGTVLNVHNQKADANMLGARSLGISDGSHWGYIESSHAQRARLQSWWRHYSESFFYFLSHDPSVPLHLRRDMSRFGLSADEFTGNGNWPYLLYFREGRRLVGDFVLTEKELLSEEPITYPDTVAVAAYHLDSREVQTVAVPDGYGNLHARTEGYLSVFLPRPYSVPFRCFLPQRTECANMLVTAASSMTHVAASSGRMEPWLAMYGVPAGIALSMLVAKSRAGDHPIPVQDFDARELRLELARIGQVTQYDYSLV